MTVTVQTFSFEAYKDTILLDVDKETNLCNNSLGIVRGNDIHRC